MGAILIKGLKRCIETSVLPAFHINLLEYLTFQIQPGQGEDQIRAKLTLNWTKISKLGVNQKKKNLLKATICHSFFVCTSVGGRCQTCFPLSPHLAFHLTFLIC